MNKEVFVSSPGRISFLGEHAWLIGEGIVLALDNLRTYISIKDSNIPGVIFSSANFKEKLNFNDRHLRIYSNHWTDYIKACIQIIEKQFNIKVDNIEIEILSVLPIAAGLSSSSALTTSVIGGLGLYYNLNLKTKIIAELAYKAEHDELNIQGSQIDQHICAIGGMLYVNIKDIPVKEFEKFTPDKEIVIVIGDTTIPKNTKKIIEDLKKRVKEKDVSIYKYVTLHKGIIKRARTHFRNTQWDSAIIGNWMNNSHDSFKNELKISSDLLDTLCESALQVGAYGARMTGAGMGGCMFALSTRDNAKNIYDAITMLGAKAYIATPAEVGFRIETKTDFQNNKLLL